MKFHSPLFFLPIGLALIFTNINFNSAGLFSNSGVDSIITLKLSFVGDLMCHTPQIEYAKVAKDSLNFNHVFEEIKPFLDSSDLSFGNLETVISVGNNNFSGYPVFNSPKEFLSAIKYAGFDVLFTSNNHCMDQRQKGIFSTIEQIKEYGIIPIGTYLSQKDRDSIRIVNARGIKIGMLSYTYGLNGNNLPKDADYLVSLIDTNRIKSDLDSLKKKNPNVKIVYFHFGEEYSREPSNYQKEVVAKTFKYGADIIIASHPHVIQKIESVELQNGNLKNGIVAYSLGNFISNQRWRYSDCGVILNIELKKKITNDSVWIAKTNIIPTWVFKGATKNGNRFIILPSDTSQLKSLPDFLNESDIKKMHQAFDDTQKMLKIN